MKSPSPRIAVLRPARTNLRRVAALALIAALGVLAACASKPKSSEEQRAEDELQAYKAKIGQIVTDPGRAAQLVAAVDEVEKMVRRGASGEHSYQAKLRALNTSYEATRAEYAALFREHDAQRTALIQEALAMRAKLTSLTTDSEWEQLKQARLATLEAVLEAVSVE
jgi:hypothetical protein